MQEYVNSIINNLQSISASLPFALSILFCFFIIVMESILPMLPLGVFIALNMILIGNILGFAISWVATSIGCLLAFVIVRKIHRSFLNNDEIKRLSNKINKIPFSGFVVITALPFTPAFLINVVSGLSDMKLKKFMTGILISKIFVVYFWGFVGTTFLQSVTDIKVLIELVIMLLAAYLLSKLAMKKYNME